MRTALLLRQSVLWLLVRIAHAVVAALAVDSPEVVAANSVMRPQPAVVLLCAVLGVVELWRRGERQLIGNLGINHWQLGALLLGPALIAEVVIAVVTGFWR